jgi:hypothetical protein
MPDVRVTEDLAPKRRCAWLGQLIKMLAVPERARHRRGPAFDGTHRGDPFLSLQTRGANEQSAGFVSV